MREPHIVKDDSPERCILARLILPQQKVDEDPLEELHGLAKTAGTEVVEELIQMTKKNASRKSGSKSGGKGSRKRQEENSEGGGCCALQ